MRKNMKNGKWRKTKVGIFIRNMQLAKNKEEGQAIVNKFLGLHE
jgi:hypothetical protein